MLTEPWTIELLGRLRARLGERVVTRFQTQKTAALLAYLAYHLKRTHPREELIELLWPEAEMEAGRQSLRQALSSLRKQLEPPGAPTGSVLIADRTNVRLNPAAVVTDTARFEAALHDAARNDPPPLQQAVDLYAGALLPGFYEEWILPERERLAEAYLNALRRLMADRKQAGDLDRAIDYALRVVAADPWNEEAHGDLMRLYASAGRPDDARRQYDALKHILRKEFDIEPSEAVRALAQELKASAAVEGRKTRVESRESRVESPPPPHSPLPTPDARPPTPTPRLPMQFNRFFGREEEITRLKEMLSPLLPWPSRKRRFAPLAPSPRLFTLTGPGGTGKTRLAIETARRLQEAYGGAVWFVPLADVTDARLIPGAILDALRQPRSPHIDPLEQVVEFLNGLSIERSVGSIEPASSIRNTQYAMLILDNFEQVEEEGALIVQELLARASALTCLVTSRRRLEIGGEREFSVPPLPVPVDGQWLMVDGRETINHPLSTMNQIASVELFVDRAQAARADFQVTPRNVAKVAALCRRLEGLPLAIELAAAWAQTLTPAQMLDRLERRLEFLVSRRKDLPERHRTLRAAIDGSYQLLTPELQRLFAQLSVFRGGWTLEAAEQVTGNRKQETDEPDPSSPSSLIPHPSSLDLLDLLAQLRSRSLILAEEVEEEMRFRLSETLCEYAREQVPDDEWAALAERHADHYLRLAEEAEPHLRGPEQAAWLDRLDREHDNLRAALGFAVEDSGWRVEGSQPSTINHQPSTINHQPSTALRLSGALAPFWEARGHVSEGRRRLAAALERSTDAPPRLRGNALNAAGNLAYLQGDLAAARRCHEECLAISRALGSRRGTAQSLNNLGLVAWNQGDHAAARSHYAESLAIKRELEDQQGVAATLSNLGLVAHAQGDLDSARAHCAESLTLLREMGNPRVIAMALTNLALVARDQSDYETAHALLEESLELRQQLEDKRGIAYSLEGIAKLEQARGDSEKAARLFGTAAALRAVGDAPLTPADRPDYDRSLAAARESLGEAAFAAAWAQGQAMTPEQTALYAREPSGALKRET